MKFRSLLSALLIAAPLALAAQTPSTKDLASRVNAHYNHLQSLETRYTERYRGMGIDRTETGTLLLRKPGRMRWSYDSPKGKLFVVDGKYAISWTPGDSQADRIPVKKLDDLHTPLRFLLGHTELEKEFASLTLAPLGGGQFTLSGAPRGMENKVRAIILTVTADGTIHAMRIEELDGAITEFAFTNLRENVPTKPEDFTFDPPAGVSIVDGASPI
ncbi:outer membrane lipoprotein carrier protein LolA [Granulicella cerasi]|uniref:Outer membrane lipoprotein carrier protein LolA n=1 Tax=Granulicella cerasi TaxID=741063 RepID=A0ABW1Z6L0_9BACT|nr:outer membrane lipoprotein carrier protein LolA [Granulicella cerasi]